MREIIRKVESSQNILLFLDYDGTLVPLKKDPDLAILPSFIRRILKDLAKKIFLCIVSGRPVLELKRYVGIKNIFYIGNHGFEISRGKNWVHPEAIKIKPLLHKTLRRIKVKTKDFRGVLIEDKGLTASIHYRLLHPKKRKKLKQVIIEEIALKNRFLRITEGKMVLEIRPKLDWDKGKGVLKLLRGSHSIEDSLLIYIGDDETDEDAFRALGRMGLTIVVSRKRNSNARFRFRNVREVWQFLRILQKTK